MVILDGRMVAEEINVITRSQVGRLKELGVRPCLALCLVGDDQASQVYVNRKRKMCDLVGIRSLCSFLPPAAPAEAVLGQIRRWNEDDTVHGIIVQLPLPPGIDRFEILNAVSPAKDVDGFHVANLGRIVHGRNRLLPCTPSGILSLLRRYDIDVAGTHTVIVNRSLVVGQPLALMLLQDAPGGNATVTVCHDRTKGLAEITSRANIIVTAVGRRDEFVLTADMVAPGAVVIDVGINRRADGSIVGDVDFDSVKRVASHITPVPGGVGPLTVASLLANTVAAAQLAIPASLGSCDGFRAAESCEIL